MIGNMLAIGNGKGGVFKTSIACNLAGAAAAAEWKVLVIDTDPQGHVALDFGIVDGDNDFGEGLRASLLEGTPPLIVSDVRPGIDVITGGEALAAAVGGLSNLLAAGEVNRAVLAFESAISKVAGQYNLVIVDTPPGEKVLLQSVFATARFLIIPTKVDKGSRQGIDRVCRDVLDAARYNQYLELLGVVPVGVSRGATQMQRQARDRLNDLLEPLGVPVLTSMIHDVGKAAVDSREVGLLASEYEAGAVQYAARPVGDKIANRGPQTVTYSSAAGSLAGDYQRLADELLGMVTAGIQSDRAAVVAAQ